MEAGGGWYTEIMSRAVGVVVVLPCRTSGFESFTGDADNDRAARLSNVTLSTTNFDELEPASGSIDLVTWIRVPMSCGSRRVAIPLGIPQKPSMKLFGFEAGRQAARR